MVQSEVLGLQRDLPVNIPPGPLRETGREAGQHRESQLLEEL